MNSEAIELTERLNLFSTDLGKRLVSSPLKPFLISLSTTCETLLLEHQNLIPSSLHQAFNSESQRSILLFGFSAVILGVCTLLFRTDL
eukprot:Awhi_evm1s3126